VTAIGAELTTIGGGRAPRWVEKLPGQAPPEAGSTGLAANNTLEFNGCRCYISLMVSNRRGMLRIIGPILD
jgi:hypothetical protein